MQLQKLETLFNVLTTLSHDQFGFIHLSNCLQRYITMGKNNLSRDIGVIICLVGLLQFHQSPQYKQCTPLENSIMTVIQLVQ